ncbi:hypothetical protein F5Y17DRAFT_462553 [Xylariaceae sp. FL0594]|nr:hypothetical protein F5Y17DRAFT_462553 [Xylariaceae sp. FL0594]
MATYSSDSDEGPPPYEEVASASTAAAATTTTRQTPACSSSLQHVPSKLSLYIPTDACYLGPHSTRPLYSVAVEYRQVVPVDVEITLHSGPSRASPPWASLRIQQSRFSLWAPKQESDAFDLSNTSVQSSTAPGLFGLSGASIGFTVPVNTGNGGPEEFEWRHGLVPDVPMFNVSSPWKLVRKHAQATAAEGEETTLATLSFKKGSRAKLLTISFEGDGASGQLGPRWLVVALLTALVVWQRKGRQ